MSIADVLAGRALWHIEQTDVLDGLRAMPDSCIHTVICSPPYYGLRSYNLPPTVWPGADPDCAHEWQENGARVTVGNNSGVRGQDEAERSITGGLRKPADDGNQRSVSAGATCARCGAVKTCLGLEPVPDCGRPGGVVCNRCFVCHLVAIFREVRRVLRADGTLWLNLGDSYATTPKGNPGDGLNGRRFGVTEYSYDKSKFGLAAKQLLMMPARVALALQADGWWVRSAITWCKRAPMPESVTDRPTSATEMVYLLTKAPSYFYDNIAVAEPLETALHAPGNRAPSVEARGAGNGERSDFKMDRMGVVWGNPAGRNLRNWWLLAPEPSDARYCAGCGSLFEGPSAGRVRTRRHDDGRVEHVCPGCGAADRWVSHFAAYPTELVKRCVLAGTSERGVCAGVVKKLRVRDDLTEAERAKVTAFLVKRGVV